MTKDKQPRPIAEEAENEATAQMPDDLFRALVAGNARVPFDALAVSAFLAEAAFLKPEGEGFAGVMRRLGNGYAFSTEQRDKYFFYDATEEQRRAKERLVNYLLDAYLIFA